MKVLYGEDQHVSSGLFVCVCDVCACKDVVYLHGRNPVHTLWYSKLTVHFSSDLLPAGTFNKTSAQSLTDDLMPKAVANADYNSQEISFRVSLPHLSRIDFCCYPNIVLYFNERTLLYTVTFMHVSHTAAERGGAVPAEQGGQGHVHGGEGGDR